MFAPPVYLQQLRIYSNQISRISDGAFYRLRNLKLLSLYGNQISSITPQTFVGLDNLDELVLHNNLITSLRNDTFIQSPLLQRLWLNSNRISCLESNTFHNLKKLSLLNLGYNQLTAVPDGVFQNTPEVLYLLLNSNRLSSVGNKPFRNLPRLLQLALSSNPIEYLAEGCFDGSNTLYYFQLSREGDQSNVFRCDCSALWLHEWMTSRPLLSSALCGKPDQFAGQDIRSLQRASFGCESAILTLDASPDCDDHVVSRGSCLQLSCSSRPRGFLSWSRADGRPIRSLPPSCSPSSSSCRQSVSGDGTLVLDNVTPEDNGYYICSASFLNQTAMKICKVTVADPPILHGDPEEVYMSYPGPPARFSLNFTGNPKPNVSWYQILPSGAAIHILESGPTSRYLISDHGSLIILQTQLEDQGTYKAIISNGAGTVTAETQLYFFFESPCRNRCLNGGECLEIRQCRCTESYAGRYCEDFIGVTEAPATEPLTQDIDNLLSTATEMIQPMKPYIDGSGSGSGSGHRSDSESGYLGSGDLEKEIEGSGLEELKDNGATLQDDEDYGKYGDLNEAVAGGAVAKRRRRRSLVRPYGIQQDRHINHKAVEERSQIANHDVVPLPIKDRDVSDSDFMVIEYEDRYDSRDNMLKFER